MKVSLCTITFRHHLLSIEDIANWARCNGFQGIELWGAHARNLAARPELDGSWLAGTRAITAPGLDQGIGVGGVSFGLRQ